MDWVTISAWYPALTSRSSKLLTLTVRISSPWTVMVTVARETPLILVNSLAISMFRSTEDVVSTVDRSISPREMEVMASRSSAEPATEMAAGSISTLTYRSMSSWEIPPPGSRFTVRGTSRTTCTGRMTSAVSTLRLMRSSSMTLPSRSSRVMGRSPV